MQAVNYQEEIHVSPGGADIFLISRKEILVFSRFKVIENL